MTIDRNLMSALPKELRAILRSIDTRLTAAEGGGGGGSGAVELIATGTLPVGSWTSPDLSDYAAVMVALGAAPESTGHTARMFFMADGEVVNSSSLPGGIGVWAGTGRNYYFNADGFDQITIATSAGDDDTISTQLVGGETYWLYGLRKDGGA